VAHRALATSRKRLFDFLAILSLLLCLATVALWVRSHGWNDNLEHDSGAPGWMLSVEFSSEAGRLVIKIVEAPYPFSHSNGWLYYSVPNVVDWQDARFGYRYITDQANTIRCLWFPHWFPALLFAILPGIRLVKIVRARRRYRPGLCPHCGYDLRATPERCPECGTRG